jgi:hypothetical protein
METPALRRIRVRAASAPDRIRSCAPRAISAIPPGRVTPRRGSARTRRNRTGPSAPTEARARDPTHASPAFASVRTPSSARPATTVTRRGPATRRRESARTRRGRDHRRATTETPVLKPTSVRTGRAWDRIPLRTARRATTATRAPPETRASAVSARGRGVWCRERSVTTSRSRRSTARRRSHGSLPPGALRPRSFEARSTASPWGRAATTRSASWCSPRQTSPSTANHRQQARLTGTWSKDPTPAATDRSDLNFCMAPSSRG